MATRTRSISWIKAAGKAFAGFPEGAQSICLAALTIAAEGGKADIVKPLSGLGSGIFEIALAYNGIKTPTYEIHLITNRIKLLKEMLK